MKKALDDLGGSVAGLDVKLLRGNFRVPLQRLAVGAWRAAFYTDGEVTYVVRVFRRANGYDWLTDWEVAT